MQRSKRLFLCFSILLILCFSAACAPFAAAPDAAPPTASSRFEVHFIDVGQADATLVLCDDQAMLIDGGNVDDSDLIVAYLQKQEVRYLDYIICSHAHEDHVGGLAAALHYLEVGQVFCPVADYDTTAFQNFSAAAAAQGLSLSLPELGSIIDFGSATMQFLGPQRDYSDTNNTSIIVRLSYGETVFLFTGDAEYQAEQDLVEANYDLSATVLQVGHHGSETSSSYLFLREVMPQYAVISVGADNSYGHPTEAVLSRLRDAEVLVYRTDLQGDIICSSDGQTVSFETARNRHAETNPTQKEPQPATSYIGNLNSLKFHRDSCANLPQEKNRSYFETREEALAAGYSACGNCNP